MQGFITILTLERFNPNLLNSIKPTFCDTEKLKDVIRFRGKARPVINSDWNIVENEISLWWNTHKDDFERAFNTFYSEYNPIDNYSGTETETYSGDNHYEGKGEGKDKNNSFDSTALKVTGATENSNDSDSHNEYTKTNTKHGNLGVTKTQEMIKDEIALRFDNNMYEMIAESLFDSICYGFWC